MRTALLPDDFPSLLRSERSCRAKFAGAPEESTIADYLVAYVRSLDSADYEKFFLALWALLEQITGGLDGTYDRNLRRTLRVYRFKDPQRREHVQAELLHLKERRNRIVQEAAAGDELQTVLHQLRGHVETLLLFILWNIREFGSLAGLRDFLDLPADLVELQRRRGILDVAIRFDQM